MLGDVRVAILKSIRMCMDRKAMIINMIKGKNEMSTTGKRNYHL